MQQKRLDLWKISYLYHIVITNFYYLLLRPLQSYGILYSYVHTLQNDKFE